MQAHLYKYTHEVCITAAKIILNHLNKLRRSKYEESHYLCIDFSEAGKVTIYAELLKQMNLKGSKLGESLSIVWEKTKLIRIMLARLKDKVNLLWQVFVAQAIDDLASLGNKLFIRFYFLILLI